MAKRISDELKRIANSDIVCGHTWVELIDLADRIDSEMVELPKDADLEPIHVGDKVRIAGRGKVEFKVDHITFFEDRTRVEADSKGEFAYSKPTDITHVSPDSLERIADELDDMVDAADSADDNCERLANLADRIRRLADKEGK